MNAKHHCIYVSLIMFALEVLEPSGSFVRSRPAGRLNGNGELDTVCTGMTVRKALPGSPGAEANVLSTRDSNHRPQNSPPITPAWEEHSAVPAGWISFQIAFSDFGSQPETSHIYAFRYHFDISRPPTTLA